MSGKFLRGGEVEIQVYFRFTPNGTPFLTIYKHTFDTDVDFSQDALFALVEEWIEDLRSTTPVAVLREAGSTPRKSSRSRRGSAKK